MSVLVGTFPMTSGPVVTYSSVDAARPLLTSVWFALGDAWFSCCMNSVIQPSVVFLQSFWLYTCVRWGRMDLGVLQGGMVAPAVRLHDAAAVHDHVDTLARPQPAQQRPKLLQADGPNGRVQLLTAARNARHVGAGSPLPEQPAYGNKPLHAKAQAVAV